MANVQTAPYRLGLDIGMASVGAALLSDTRILALHVRTFNRAETADKGESLGLVRREAKGTRKRIRRRAHRLLRLRRLLKRSGLLPDASPEALQLPGQSPWDLRASGLDRRLEPAEWAGVIYHIVKHRGFQSTRKSDAKTDVKVGQMLSGVSANKARMKEHGYRSVGELAARDASYSDYKRNKGGEYRHTFDRADLSAELHLLFEQQRQFGSPHADVALEEQVYTLLMARRPALSGDKLMAMVGKCSLEPAEYRAPKASYRAERFVWLGKLNNLKLTGTGEARPLTETERLQLIELPFVQSKLTYKQVRKLLDLPEHLRFNLVSYGVSAKGKDKDPEEAVFFEAMAFHSLRKVYEEAGLKSCWQRDSLDADRLDTLAYALSCFKEDNESRAWLSVQGVEPAIVEAVLELSFDKFISFSQKALRNILPLMEQGKRTDEARDAMYPPQLNSAHVKTRFLPAPDKNIIRNPVVYRALNQARKLVNAIVAQYGPPQAVHIELARDLSKPFEERRKIKKEQDEFQDRRKKDADQFRETFHFEPNAKLLHKYRLYREQDGKCAYSLRGLDLASVISDDNYAQIDHILPYSRSFDDSQNNKVLVLTAANQNKGNRTPYEYLDGESESPRWRLFEAWVHTTKGIRLAKRNRLLRKHFGEEDAKGFRDRNLNDTRYICREFKTMVDKHLERHPLARKDDFCVPLAGQLTSLLRARWGLIKIREDGDLHHALDAAVIAAADRSMIQKMALYSQRRELGGVKGNDYVDPKTGEVINLDELRKIDKAFPQPWPHFHHELDAWRSPKPAEALFGLDNYTPEILQTIRPVRVSRAPLRRGLGAAHQETIRSVGKAGVLLEQGKSAIKTSLTKLKLKNLEDIVGAADPRNDSLIQAIRERLEAFGGDGAKAFAESQPPLLKPTAVGKNAPRIRSVKLLATQKSGIPIRHGIADNDSMLRVDVFSKSGKYYTVPIYVADAATAELPNRAVVAYKPEAEWPEMDASYTFCFSLHANDWLRVTLKDSVKEGYFSGLNRSNGAAALWVHDRNKQVGKDGFLEGIGLKTALSVEKLHVDLLGNLHRGKPETRQPLHQSRQKE
jgi:CRISPR-associated endonuclease Csn1